MCLLCVVWYVLLVDCCLLFVVFCLVCFVVFGVWCSVLVVGCWLLVVVLFEV